MDEIKAIHKIYKMLTDNFNQRQIKRILDWLGNKFEEEGGKDFKPREETLRERYIKSGIQPCDASGSSAFRTD